MNNWDIPIWLENEVRGRDKTCIYCGVPMTEKTPPRRSRKAVATWEHIVNDATIITRENIARCCAACNSSKGTKRLSEWIQSTYCKKRGINKGTVAEVVKEALKRDMRSDANKLQGSPINPASAEPYRWSAIRGRTARGLGAGNIPRLPDTEKERK